MKIGIVGLLVVGLLYSCAGRNTGNPDVAQDIPSNRSERVGSSVSPRSELEFTDTYAGHQSPRMSNIDTTILEPMRSVTTRSAPDASDFDATDAGDAVDNTNSSMDR